MANGVVAVNVTRRHSFSDIIKTFFQDQDLNFKTKPSVQNQDFALQDQDLFVMYTRGRPKSNFFIFGRKTKMKVT